MLNVFMTKLFMFSTNFSDLSETTTWLELDDGVKVEIYLCQGQIVESTTPRAKLKGFMNTLKKKK